MKHRTGKPDIEAIKRKSQERKKMSRDNRDTQREGGRDGKREREVHKRKNKAHQILQKEREWGKLEGRGRETESTGGPDDKMED